MKKKAALYDPYLDVLGGGEKYILSILKTLEDAGYEIYVFWNSNLTTDIKERLKISFKKITFLPNIFSNKKTLIEKVFFLRNFDLFFYVTDGSYFFSTAKKNFIYAMTPQKNLYNFSLINKIKILNYQFITHSQFTKNALKKWQVKAHVIYPYLNDEFVSIKVNSLKKDKIILSVGRFFKHLHSKRQDLAISLFKKFKHENPLFKDFKLILAGGLKKEDKPYFSQLLKMAEDDPAIIFKPNISFNNLFDLYKKSLIYWHLTGFGVDEENSPQLVEHLGIAPLEAMASGSITFCYNAGGPKEMIVDQKNGFLFSNEHELLIKMNLVLQNQDLQRKIRFNAERFVKQNFNYQVFQQNVLKLINTK